MRLGRQNGLAADFFRQLQPHPGELGAGLHRIMPGMAERHGHDGFDPARPGRHRHHPRRHEDRFLDIVRDEDDGFLLVLPDAEQHDDVAPFLFVDPAFAQTEADILLNRQPRKQRIGLEHHAAIRAWARHVLPVECHGAAGRWVAAPRSACRRARPEKCG
eukprot:gene7136-8791_t